MNPYRTQEEHIAGMAILGICLLLILLLVSCVKSKELCDKYGRKYPLYEKRLLCDREHLDGR